MIINGGARKNELILSLDNKLFSDLSKNLKEMVKTIFPDIKNKDIISCKAVNSINHNMILAVNGISKNISVKTGNTSLIFKDKMIILLSQLLVLKVSNNTISSLIRYHRGYVSSETGFKSFGSMLKEDFKEEIECVKNEFKNVELLSKLIDLILLKEKNGVDIDYFYYGNAQIGRVMSASELKRRIIESNDNYPHDFMKIGPFNFLPITRNICNDEGSKGCLLRINNMGKYFISN